MVEDEWVYDSDSFRSGLAVGRVLTGWRQADIGLRVVSYPPDGAHAPIHVIGLEDTVGVDDPGTIYYEARQMMNIPVFKGGLTYNGRTKTPKFTFYDKDIMEMTGVVSATDAGTYEVTFTLTDPTRYKWAIDGTTEPKKAEWYIAKAKVKKPYVVEKRYKYDKTKKTAVLYGFIESLMEKGGVSEATAAGKYIVTVALKDPDNYEWAD